MRFLLDTDHITLLQREDGPEFRAISSRVLEAGEGEVGFSVVSFHEQVLGANSFISKATRAEHVLRGYVMLARIIEDFARVPVALLDSAALSRFQDLRAQKVRVPTMDLRIASIALSRGLVLVTRNARDFARVPGLRIEDWSR